MRPNQSAIDQQMAVSSYPGAQSAYAQAAAQVNHHHQGLNARSGLGHQQQQDCLDYEAKFQVL